MVRFLSLCIIVIFLLGNTPIANGVTPLKFHVHFRALIEATVVEISILNIPTLDTNKFMSRKPREESIISMPVARIQLRVNSILCSKAISTNAVDIIEKGSLIVITNQWLDQKAPFISGDHITGKVQLVSSHEVFNPLGEDNQWWFYNTEEKDSNSPPRNPFKHVTILH